MDEACYIDFETLSRCDIKKRGTHKYTHHASTDIHCLCFAFKSWNIKQTFCWRPGQPFPKELKQFIRKGGELHAHNAEFEIGIWEQIGVPKYGFPEVQRNQWVCTATQARANAMPGALDPLSIAIGGQRKDKTGNDLIKALCIPQPDGTFLDDPVKLAKLIDYCRQDVRAERSVADAMRDLTEDERVDYLISTKINDRGVKVDRDLASAAVKYAADEAESMRLRVAEITEGACTKVRGEGVKKWVVERLTDDQRTLIKKENGKYSLDAQARDKLLNQPEGDLRADVHEVLECTDAVSKSSVGKFSAALNWADLEDHRVRGAFVLYGAGQTHRYSSRGTQLHNFPRKCMAEPEAVREDMIAGMPAKWLERKYGLSIMAILSGMLRPMLIAEEGKSFVVGDWSAIEARGLPWLANSPGAERVLDHFRAGRDLYVETAKTIPGADRFIGKVAVLSLGYGGAVGAFIRMAAAYGIEMDEMKALRIVRAWRSANPWATEFWYTLYGAAMRAVRNPGQVYKAGRINYAFNPSVLGGALYCLLPNGRLLTYPHTRIDVEDIKAASTGEVIQRKETLTCMKASLKPKQGDKQWPRMYLWHGLLAENVTQSICGGVLRDSLQRLYDAPVVGHVHDEIILEVPDKEVELWTDTLRHVMTVKSEWAEGLPLAAEIWSGKRYKK